MLCFWWRCGLPIGSFPSTVYCFSRRFPCAKASKSNTSSLSAFRLRLQDPHKQSSSSSLSFASSFSSSVHGAVAVAIVPVRLRIQPKPELSLLSLLFVLSMAFGALISLAIVSIPTMNAFKRLAASVEELSDVVSQEVPGTLTSLRLSGFEIHELTQQLITLRQKISSSSRSKKKTSRNSTSINKEEKLA